jgi:hypothetical protein
MSTKQLKKGEEIYKRADGFYNMSERKVDVVPLTKPFKISFFRDGFMDAEKAGRQMEKHIPRSFKGKVVYFHVIGNNELRINDAPARETRSDSKVQLYKLKRA